MTTSMSARRSTARAGAAATERAIDAELAHQLDVSRAEQRAARAQTEARRALGGAFGPEDLESAFAVETSHHGWAPVLKVNRTTVVVDCFGRLNVSIGKVIGAACRWPRSTQ